ncbi:hypothetical protein JMN32_06115 [Fulvivirga sp. 29W222]|uniref:Uncharacterized protein n=1 Tax=Fulvivirga marina TaxID=2494733 RepID=A0A937FVQ4_9BACT|nr:hypothetical protein [Fulvivirga marina]MBL6445873.1 hypothetical protein [Fulvivirga marina]
MTFQEQIEKKLERRVTIVGDKVFTAAIDSSVSKESEIDWRREGYKTLDNRKVYELPEDIKSRMLQMIGRLGLNMVQRTFC